MNSERYKSLNFDMTIGSSLYTEVRDPDDVYPTRFVPEFMSSTSVPMSEGWIEHTPDLHAHIVDQADKISKELDPVARQAMVWALEKKLAHEVNAYLILGWTNIFPAWGAQVGGWTSSNHYSQLKWAMWERVWLNE